MASRFLVTALAAIAGTSVAVAVCDLAAAPELVPLWVCMSLAAVLVGGGIYRSFGGGIGQFREVTDRDRGVMAAGSGVLSGALGVGILMTLGRRIAPGITMNGDVIPEVIFATLVFLVGTVILGAVFGAGLGQRSGTDN